MTLSMTALETKTVDTIRTLSMEGVQKAKSGHPGTAMALAPVTYLLYNERMKYDPANPLWPGRDRFILSIGHASMLIYSTLHVAGIYDLDASGKPLASPAVTLDDLKNFRQLGSRCAGHPEYRHVAGVEMTTGPLGAGVATSVGMAMADRWLAARYNKPEYRLFDSNVYALCGDGDMMEGVSSEAASLAGHLKLSNLCWIYDDNKITIEGSTDLAFTDDVKKRFEAYNWNVIEVDDVNDLPQLRKAFDQFEATTDRPTLIIVKSVIAYGAPTKAGTAGAHGAPLGEDEVRAARKFYGFDENESFTVEEEVYQAFQDGLGTRGDQLYKDWSEQYKKYRESYPVLAGELDSIFAGRLPQDWKSVVTAFPADEKGMASRASGGKVLNNIGLGIPWLVGGSADLAPSNCTELKFPNAGAFGPEVAGRNVHFGVRENAMAAATNGLVLAGLRGYCATFFVFADYLRPMIRLAAIMQIPTVFIFTHDSIGVGEDGPTHQPVEQLASLRAIPNVAVFRPADANEVVASYEAAFELKRTPSVIVLTRQNLPTLDRSVYGSAKGVAFGAYVLADAPKGNPKVVLIGTGSEVGLCLKAWEMLNAQGIAARVVSMPSWELFDQQPVDYKNRVLPPNVPKVAVELGIQQGWERYLGNNGVFLGMKGFGASGPADVLMKHFGFTPEHVVELAHEVLKK